MGWVGRLLGRADARNQVILDAAAGRVDLTGTGTGTGAGTGIVFVTTPHFTDGAAREWAPRVRVDDGESHRLAFGTVFVEAPPGRRHLHIENGAPHLWRRSGIDLMVDVPPDGQVTLHVRGELLQHMLPTVTPSPESADAVWLRRWQTMDPESEVNSALGGDRQEDHGDT